MIDVFLEESIGPTDSTKAGRKYKTAKMLSLMFLVSAIFFTVLLFMVFSMPFNEGVSPLDYFLFNLLPVIIMCFISYALYIVFRIKKHTYLVDYDYTFITGELRIAKVLNGLKRRPVAKIDCANISVLGKITSDKYLRYKTMPGIKLITATPNADSAVDEVYFAVCMYNGNKTILLFQPSQAMVYNIKKFAGRGAEYV